MGTLYVVATPIGNLEDITFRAARVLGEVSLVAAEDTRLTRRLLAHLGLHTPLVSWHAHSGPGRSEAIVARLADGDVALVTDAGTPGVSDPGPALVAAARAAGHTIVPIPGPSAVTAALSVAGLPADAYRFVGFLPRRGRERRAALIGLPDETATMVLYEAPHRWRACLADLAGALGGDRPITVGRELTKQFEEVWHGTLAEAQDRWRAIEPRGEFVLVIAGAPPADRQPWDDARVSDELAALRRDGIGAREAARRVAALSGRTARDVYRLWPHAD
jgi:16S rRNA (cytidine1402-2'-O)-methyltransferase